MTCYSLKILRGQKESCWCQRSCALLVRSPQEEGWYTDGYRFLRQQKKATSSSLRSWWLSVGESIIQACVLSVNKTCLQPQSVWAAITPCLHWVAWKTQKRISHSSGGLEAQEHGAGRFGVWWGPPSLFITVFCCVLTWQKVFPEDTKPSWPNHFPKATPPNAITLGVRTSTYEFWEDTNVLVYNRAVRK